MTVTAPTNAARPALGSLFGPDDETPGPIDFRRHFAERQLPSGRDDNLRADCPACGRARHLWIYHNHVHCFHCGYHALCMPYLVLAEGYSLKDAAEILYALWDGRDGVVRPAAGPKAPEPPDDTWQERAARYVAQAHERLDAPARDWWANRLVSDPIVAAYELGVRDGRAVIPCRTPDGRLFAVKRRKLDDQRAGPRYDTLTGSHVRYAPFVLSGEGRAFAIVVAGEIKALALKSLLEARSLPWTVIASCNGEHPWQAHWNRYAAFAEVALWPDADEPGRRFVAGFRECRNGDVTLVYPSDDAKAVDDFMRAGGDPVAAIMTAMRWA